MSGPIINYIKTSPKIVFIEGALVGIALFWFLFVLHRKKYFEEVKIIGFFFFLMLSELYIVFFGKLAISHYPSYCLSEFRYQYIPNAFVILIIVYIIDRFLRPSRNGKRIMYTTLMLLFAFNVYCSHRIIEIYNSHLFDLKKMIYSIRCHIKQGTINGDSKVYIDEDMPDYLPSLCWNSYMGERFIKEGNYRWMFSKKEVNYFADNIGDAKWIIDKEKFSVVLKSAKSISKK